MEAKLGRDFKLTPQQEAEQRYLERLAPVCTAILDAFGSNNRALSLTTLIQRAGDPYGPNDYVKPAISFLTSGGAVGGRALSMDFNGRFRIVEQEAPTPTGTSSR